MGGSSPAPPNPPDYAAATREGILTDIETLPARRAIEAAYHMGRSGSFSLDGKTYNYDFRGIGDADFARQQNELNRESAMAQAQSLLDVQQKYGQQFLTTAREQLRASDPIGFALRENLGQQVSNDLALGQTASDEDLRNVQQRVRAVQTRLGNTNGVAAGVQEVMAQGDFQRALQQQRIANASAFLAGTTPLSQFGQLRTAGQGAAPFAPVAFNATGLNANAGALSTQFAANVYGAQGQMYAEIGRAHV